MIVIRISSTGASQVGTGDVLALAWPESRGLSPASSGFGLLKPQNRPEARPVKCLALASKPGSFGFWW